MPNLRLLSLRKWLLPLWLLGTLATLLQIEALPDTSFGQGYEPLAVARSLVAGHGFANPYQTLPTGPTAHVAPVYPGLVAGVIHLRGGEAGAVLPLTLLHAAVHGLQFALLPALAMALFGDARAGLLAALMLAGLPMFPLTVQIEIIFQTVALMAALLIRPKPGNAAPAGLFAAFALHISPSIVFCLAGWLWWRRPGRRWTLIWTAALLAASLPWAVRNYELFGRLIFVRDNLPLELYVSNNALAEPDMRSGAAMVRFHPNFNRAEAEQVLSLGEARYMSTRGRLAMAWMLAHPARFAQLTFWRIWAYWFPTVGNRPWQGWLIWLVTILTIPALPRLARNPVFFAVFAVSPLIYYVAQADLRYRLPYLWATLLGAGWTLVWVWDQFARPDRSTGARGTSASPARTR